MLTNIFFTLLGDVMMIIQSIVQTVGNQLNLPLTQVNNSIGYFLGSAYYFQGVWPIQETLNFLGRCIGVIIVLWLLIAFEWIYHKIPWLGH